MEVEGVLKDVVLGVEGGQGMCLEAKDGRGGGGRRRLVRSVFVEH